MNWIHSILSKIGDKLFKVILLLFSYFAPVYPLLLCATVFCIIDFFTGIAAAKKQNTYSSKKVLNKLKYWFVYALLIMGSFYFHETFSEFVNYKIHNIVAFIIVGNEFWSFIANASVLINLPLNKDKLFKYLKEFSSSQLEDNEKAT